MESYLDQQLQHSRQNSSVQNTQFGFKIQICVWWKSLMGTAYINKKIEETPKNVSKTNV